MLDMGFGQFDLRLSTAATLTGFSVPHPVLGAANGARLMRQPTHAWLSLANGQNHHQTHMWAIQPSGAVPHNTRAQLDETGKRNVIH